MKPTHENYLAIRQNVKTGMWWNSLVYKLETYFIFKQLLSSDIDRWTAVQHATITTDNGSLDSQTQSTLDRPDQPPASTMNDKGAKSLLWSKVRCQ